MHARSIIRSLFVSMVAATLLGACSGRSGDSAGSGGGGAEEGARVKGRLVATLGQGLSGVHVHQDGESGATTLEDGAFSIPIAAGSIRLLAEVGQGDPTAILLDILVATEPGEELDLGDIQVDSQQDSDADGVADVDEMTGWTILLNLSARRTLSSRAVTSDPSLPDTDGDGLTDGEENAALLDPRKRDSDGDLLGDLDEIFRYKSNPVDVDSDEDAAGIDGAQLAKPSLFDGQEVTKLGTSPTLADTDGDGLTDYEEIAGAGLDPRIADLPNLLVEPISDPEVVLNYETASSQGRTSDAFRLTSTATEATSEDVDKRTEFFEASGELELSASPSFKASFKGGWTDETTSTIGAKEAQEVRDEYRDVVTSDSSISVKDGALSVAMQVTNTSSRSILVTDLSVIAYRQTPGALRTRAVVGLLTPAAAAGSTFPAVLLGPGSSFSFVAANETLPVATVTELLAHPGSLVFEVANYTMTQVDDKGAPLRDFGATGERVLERCALVVVDYGNGDRRRAFVATSVERTASGKSAGLSLRKALTEVLGLPIETQKLVAQDASNANVTTAIDVIRGVGDLRGQVLRSSAQTNSTPVVGRTLWIVSVSDASAAMQTLAGIPTRVPADFDDIVLHNGESAYLIYTKDADGDGLSDSRESLRSTALDRADSDADGVPDGDEVDRGWDVEFRNVSGVVDSRFTYAVRSDPNLPDADDDGVADATERTNRTDPNAPDTDADGIGDLFDTVQSTPSALLELLLDPTLRALWRLDLSNASGAAGPSAIVPDAGTAAASVSLAFSRGNPLELQRVRSASDRFGVASSAAFFYNGDANFGGTYFPQAAAHYGGVLPAFTSHAHEISYVAWIRTPEYRPDYVRVVGFPRPSTGGDQEFGPALFLKRSAAESYIAWRVPLENGGVVEAQADTETVDWNFVAGTAAFEGGRTVVRLYGNDGSLRARAEGPSGARPLRPVVDPSATSNRFGIGAANTGTFGSTYSAFGTTTGVVELAVDDVRVYDRAIPFELVRKLFRERNYR